MYASVVLTAVHAVAAPALSVGIMTFEASGGASPELARQLTARAAELVGRRTGVRVITPDDIRALILREEQRQRLGCTDQECLTEIAGALGADRLISGQIAKLADGWSVTLAMLDTQAVSALARATERWGGPSLELLDLIEPMVARLWEPPGAELFGAIELSGAESGSEVVVDGILRGEAPIAELRSVPAGGRKLTVVRSGFEPFVRWVVVFPGRPTRVVVDQLADDKETPLYGEWWFWGLVAAGVAAGGAAAAIALSDNGGGGGATGVEVGVNIDDAITGGR